MKHLFPVLLALLLLLSACGRSSDSDVDVDLTTMSATVVFGEVSNMIFTPEEYEGKTVRMAGAFNVVDIPTTGMRYYSCLIADATACCKQGLEFQLKNGGSFPEDYPRLGAEITVVGTFETYEEDGMTYCRVADAVFE